MAAKSKAKWSPDITSILGLVIGFGGIFVGLILEGGRISDVAQLTGAVIVLSGTCGAVMVTTPTAVFFRALGQLRTVFFEPQYEVGAVIARIVEFSNRARRNGIVSLEKDVDIATDPFLRKALSLGVDGTEIEEIRRIMEIDIEIEERQGRADAKVFESAGGYAPTIGIIGAVLGLIQVMKNLQQLDLVGHGIAVAFVATIYGVGLANLILLPAAAKIRNRAERLVHLREMMLEGICSIVQGVNPKIVERKLLSWSGGAVVQTETTPKPSGARRFAQSPLS